MTSSRTPSGAAARSAPVALAGVPWPRSAPPARTLSPLRAFPQWPALAWRCGGLSPPRSRGIFAGFAWRRLCARLARKCRRLLIVARPRVATHRQHVARHAPRVAQGGDAAARCIVPFDRHLDHPVAPAARQVEELDVEAPAAQRLRGGQLPRHLAAEALEAAL